VTVVAWRYHPCRQALHNPSGLYLAAIA